MTTIAYDGISLAADSRMTEESHIVTDSFNKIWPITQGRYEGGYFAPCGEIGESVKVFRFYNEETQDAKMEIKDFSALMWYDGQMYEIDSSLAPYPVPAPWACGSGAPFARIAMKLYKKDAKNAVKDAIKMDSASGGTIEVVKLVE